MIDLDIVNKLLWSTAISLILVNSIYFSLKLRFPQFKLIKALKSIKEDKKKQEISPKDTLIMALSSKIGVGSLSGTALCIYYGGIGTVFWIFISTFILSIINYIENVLAIIYKEKYRGNTKSGPHYYIKKGLNNKALSTCYAVIVLILYIFLFSSIQNNTITTLTTSMLNINKVAISLIITILTGLIITKGIKGISAVCNKIFPIMMTIFIVIGLIVIMKNIQILPNIIIQIIKEAFNNKSITGGIIHNIIITFQKSVFANESGVGTSAIISGSTENNNYHLQAKIGLIQTYFINYIVLGMTSLIIITAKTMPLDITNGIELTKSAFYYHLGHPGEVALLLILTLFSFSTMITIYYYGESSLEFLTKNKKATSILKMITIFSIFIGGIIKATAIWNLIDIFLAVLTIINMYAIYKLRETIVKNLLK